jgi:hypothetical protein
MFGNHCFIDVIAQLAEVKYVILELAGGIKGAGPQSAVVH